MLTRIALFCYRFRRLVTGMWAGGLIVLVALAGVAAGSTSDDYTVPDSGSNQALALLRAHGLSDDQTGAMRVVFRDPHGLRSPAARAAIASTLQQVEDRLPGSSVTGPFDPTGSHQISPDGTVGYAQVRLRDGDAGKLTDAQLADVPGKVDQVAASAPGLQTAFAGPMFETATGGGAGEGIGILAAAVILFLAFGSVLAMVLPLVVGLFGASCGVIAVMMLANFVDMSSAAVPLASLLAIGVGIDYSLLVVTRYRESLSQGMDPMQAVGHAQNTAGRAVLFAGTTVVMAVLGLLAMNMPLINGVAIGAALAVAVTMAASLTLLPALLGFVGTRIDRFGLRRRGGPAAGRGDLARRWSQSVQRRPWQYAVGSLLLLGVLTAPVFTLRLGFSDASTLPAGNTARQAYDMLADGFGPGVNGPLFAVLENPSGNVSQADLARLHDRVGATSGVAAVSRPLVSPDGEVGMLVITPTTGPATAATADLARRVRDEVLPSTVKRPNEGYLTGSTAAVVDFSDYTAARLPAFIAVVMVLAFLLLLVVFRSIVVPAKAVVMNLLSIGASFGVLVAAVQWGWASGLFGVDHSVPVITWVPMMMVAVVFGLSMDYEVFLLSRMKEHHDAGEPSARAVSSGLASTSRVITAAAAIMVCVFASFLLGGAVDLAVFGFGLAVAVLIDATLVRMVLVPSAMQLLGERNWWIPGWLDRSLPRLASHGRAPGAHDAPDVVVGRSSRSRRPPREREPAAADRVSVDD